MAAARLLGLLMVALLVSAPLSASALSCGQVFSNLVPCIAYLRQGGQVAPACCGGIKNLAAAASTPADRRIACTCLKSAAAGVGNVNFGRAAGLPSMCKVSIPYKIDPKVDCNKIN